MESNSLAILCVAVRLHFTASSNCRPQLGSYELNCTTCSRNFLCAGARNNPTPRELSGIDVDVNVNFTRSSTNAVQLQQHRNHPKYVDLIFSRLLPGALAHSMFKRTTISPCSIFQHLDMSSLITRFRTYDTALQTQQGPVSNTS